MTASFGSFQLTSVAKLPNVTVAFRGEHWSDGKAASTIVPGSLVVPTSSGGARVWTVAASGAVDPRSAVALRVVSVPDANPGSEYNPQLTPNDIVNLAIKQGEFVHAYRSGAFHLTLIAEDSYVPGDLIMWDPNATPVAGKPSPGAWKKTATAANAFFEVIEFDSLSADSQQGILTVHSLRSQF